MHGKHKRDIVGRAPLPRACGSLMLWMSDTHLKAEPCFFTHSEIPNKQPTLLYICHFLTTVRPLPTLLRTWQVGVNVYVPICEENYTEFHLKRYILPFCPAQQHISAHISQIFCLLVNSAYILLTKHWYITAKPQYLCWRDIKLTLSYFDWSLARYCLLL